MTSAAIVDDPTAPRAAAPAAQPRAASTREDMLLRDDARTAAVTDTIDWERLWLAAQRATWSTLALVPIGEGISTPRLAAALADVGRRHLGGTVVATNATNVTLTSLQTELSSLAERARCAERAVVALPPLLGSPAGLALARASDAVILCVTLGSSSIAEATQVVADIGHARVLGSLIVRPRAKELP